MKRYSINQAARGVRVAAAVLALACAGLMIISTRRGWEVLVFDRASFILCESSLAIGFREARPTAVWDSEHEHILGPLRENRSFLLSPEYASAWRPFHLAPFSGARHHLVVPIWQFLLAATAAACLSHGYLVGLKRGNPGNCSRCGYNLAGVPTSSACPECGQARA